MRLLTARRIRYNALRPDFEGLKCGRVYDRVLTRSPFRHRAQAGGQPRRPALETGTWRERSESARRVARRAFSRRSTEDHVAGATGRKEGHGLLKALSSRGGEKEGVVGHE